MHQILEREISGTSTSSCAPDLDRVVGRHTVAHDTVDLVSTYYDTAEGDLRACGILVRRRRGEDDTGWQLKFPPRAAAPNCAGRCRSTCLVS